MLVYHSVDSDLWFGIFFEKGGAAEKGGIRFEIGDLVTSAHLYSLVKKFHVECFCFFIVFGDKKITFY